MSENSCTEKEVLDDKSTDAETIPNNVLSNLVLLLKTVEDFLNDTSIDKETLFTNLDIKLLAKTTLDLLYPKDIENSEKVIDTECEKK